ncbi:hypothetical protein CA54_08760 [Symmachiella macrocystis]|uniref:Uncharacterized protein n=1 Tax=Symmachiella macrocystis TaxID=2527985 RepID=A0A5C6BJ48_9PLAN|nr:hypothetical protein [Symmachiella macrocystis]TWU12060.1 hypothetical protein CA54_08760 [Symmachiella macrocystis]
MLQRRTPHDLSAARFEFSPRRCVIAAVGLLLVAAAFSPQRPVIAQEQPTAEIPGRRIFVPVEDLDVVLNRDKQGVLLPRDKFSELYAAAKKNNEQIAEPPHGVILSQAAYRARTSGDRLLITATIEVTQLEAGWHAVPLRFTGLSVEQAKLGDGPAQLGRHSQKLDTVYLLNDQVGKQTLTLELSAPLVSSGSDQLAKFGCMAIPSATLEIDLPAGRYLVLNSVMPQRGADEDQPAHYREAIGGKQNISLRITGKEAQQGEDALVFGTTGIGVRVAPEELTWQAISDVSVYGKPIDRLTFSIPDSLDIVSVESTGLEGWGFEPNPAEKRTMLTLSYRQAFRDTRRIVFRGVTSTTTGTPWNVPNLTLSNATAHTSRIIVQHAPMLRLRADQLDGVRRIADSDEVATEIRRIAADTAPGEKNWQSLYFAAWQEDFKLAFVTQPKAGELQAAIATQLDVGTIGLDLRSSISIEPRFVPLFGLDLSLPAAWEISRITVGNTTPAWRVTSLADGVQHVQIPFEKPLPADQMLQIGLVAQWRPDDWPVEDQPLEFAIPEIRLPQVDVLEGTFTIRSTKDLRVVPRGLSGLDPSRDIQTDGSSGEWLSYDYQDTRFAGQLRIERKPSRISATTLSFARLEPETWHAHLEAAVNIDGGGLRSLRLELPEATGEDLRFRLHNRNLRIVEQHATPEIANGRRTWTLRFDQRDRGVLRLSVDVEMPRGDAETFTVPDLRIVGAERQNGFTAIEGSGEQQLTLTAVDANDAPLAEIAPEDLPLPANYRPQERIVAAYHHVRPAERISLSETRFERMPVPTAICDELLIESVLGETGYLQHQASFKFRAVGVQGLEVRLPSETALWATLVDDQPVEVRRIGDAYRVPLPVSGNDESEHLIVLSYTSQMGALNATGRLSQTPPQLAIVSGAGAVQPLEILRQAWTIHHPRDTRFLAAHDLYQPEVEPVAPSLLGGLQRGVSIGSWQDLLGKAFVLVTALAVLLLVTVGYRKLGASGAVGVGIACLVGVFVLASMMPAVQQIRMSSTGSRGDIVIMAGAENGITSESMAVATDAESSSAGDSITVHQPKPESSNMNQKEWLELSSRRMKALGNQMSRPLSSDKPQQQQTSSNRQLADLPVADEQSGEGEQPSLNVADNGRLRGRAGGLGGRGGIGGSGGTAGTSGQAGTSGSATGGVPLIPWDGSEKSGGEANSGPQPPIGGWGATHPPGGQALFGDNLAQNQDGDGQPQPNAPADNADPFAAQFGANAIQAPQAANQQASTAKPTSLGGLLSLDVKLTPPAGSRGSKYYYVGAADAAVGPKLEVDYLKDSPVPFVTIAWMAGMLVVCWFLRAKLLAARAAVAVLGLSLPLGLAALAPPNWMPALDGVFLGTLAGIAVWIAIPMIRECFDGEQSLGGTLKTSILKRTATLLLVSLITTALTGPLQADENQEATPRSKTRIAKPVPPIVSPQPIREPSIVIPYDTGSDATAAERIFLPHKKFVELWNQAHPDQRILAPAPVEAMVAEAMYAAEIDAAAGQESAIINIIGRIVAYSYRDRQVALTLPLGNIALDSVEVDGKAAALTPRAGDGGTDYELLLDRPGMHVIDLKFRIPYERTGPAGRFTLPLRPVAAGALRFQLPGSDLNLRINGGSGAYRRQKLGDTELAVIPVDRGGKIEVAWQPRQTRAGVDGVIHTETATALSVDDAGVNITSTFDYRVRQGSMNFALFALPADVTVRKISGKDVAGWAIEGPDNDRQLRVFLGRKVEDQTELTFDLFVARQFTAESNVLTLPAFAPLQITRETGRIAVYAGNQFAVTSSVISGLTQIETKNLVLPVRYAHVDPRKQQAVAAYRFTTRPFQLDLLVRRQQPGLTGSAEHAILISTRKIRLRSQMHLKLAGAPKSTITVQLPPNYLLLDAVSPHLSDWSTTDTDNGALLHLELASPMTGAVPLEISGVIPRQPDDLNPALQVPTATEADSLRSSVAVWLDSIYSGTMNNIGDWRSVDPERLSSELRGRIQRPVQFAFTAAGTELPAIGLTLQQRRPLLAAAALTTIIAKDTAVEYSIACKWKITRAAADTFSFTTPAWLSGKMDFQGTGYRQISETPAGEERIRWTVELDDPRRDEFFVVANVTLPPPSNGKIIAPSIQFENAQPNDDGTISQLETQTEYQILVNHSRDQIDLASTDAVQTTDAQEVRIINLPDSLLQQAVDILRVTQPDVAVTWNLRKLQQVKSLPASVNLADNKLVIAQDGSWRAQASYRINNRNRQFLALTMPSESRILSVFVAGKPSRPVQTTKDGKQLTLIALPKTVAGDFSFTADIVYAGRLPQRLPNGVRATSLNFDLPHADVVTPKQDDEFGIPVSKTAWTVYLPNDIEASIIDDPARSNLKLVTTDQQRYDLGITLMKETEDYLTTALEEDNRGQRFRAVRGLFDIEKQSNQIAESLKEVAEKTNDKKKLAELKNQQARLQDKLGKVRRKLELEEQTANESSPSQSASTGRLMIGAGVNSDNNGAIGNSFISGELFNSNSGVGITIDDSDSVLKLDDAPLDKSQAGKSKSIEQRRGRLQEQLVQQKGALKDQHYTSSLQEVDEASIPFSNDFIAGAEVDGETPAQGDGEAEPPVRSLPDLDSYPKYGGITGFSDQSGIPASVFDPAIAETGVLFGGRGVDSALDQAEPQPQDQQWTAAGGLSLLIDVPTTGQKLTLSKVGGRPKLALSLRPQAFRDTLFDTAWLVVWAGLGLSIVLALRRPTASAAIMNLAPIALMIAGGVWYFLLPLAPIGFVIVMLAALWLAIRHRHVTA